MEVRYAMHPDQAKHLTTDELRKEFLIQNIFEKDKIKTIYSHNDRVITGGACPVSRLKLEAGDELRADFFLQRRELGIINVGGPGKVTADGTEYALNIKDGLYLGMGTKDISFDSTEKANPAKFYFISVPAHKNYPNEKVDISKAAPTKLGSQADSNTRTIYKYFHPDGVKSCQLVMGMTILEEGNVWNSMPCHTHERRMEVYFYFDLKENALVFHMMGQPSETRHVIMRNEEAVISPSWSIHAGGGTSRYSFIWAMAGENQAFGDMDAVDLKKIK